MIATFFPRLRWPAVLAIAFTLSFASAALAWQDLSVGDLAPESQQDASRLSLPFRLGMFFAMLIVAGAVGFYIIFPWLLKHKHAMRPLQAYGLSVGLIWAVWCISALVVFQDVLVLKSAQIQNSFVQDWLLICLIVLMGVVGFISMRIFFGGRSSATDA